MRSLDGGQLQQFHPFREFLLFGFPSVVQSLLAFEQQQFIQQFQPFREFLLFGFPSVVQSLLAFEQQQQFIQQFE